MEPLRSMRISSLIALASISLVVTADPYCGSASLDPFTDRIVGGVEVSPHEYPWLVKLYKKNDGFYCGATLIADRYLITAGHCLVRNVYGVADTITYERYPPEDFSVELGSHSLNESDPVTRTIVKYHLHPQFNLYIVNDEVVSVNDIAILKMEPIDFNYYILPICLPPIGKLLADNTDVVMAGWGNLKGKLKDNLTKVPVKTPFVVMSPECCKNNTKVGQMANALDQLSLHQAFCVTHNGSSSCRGDSGGPIFLYTFTGFELAGIISSDFGCDVDIPGYCTQVSMYIAFIKDNTKDGVYLQREEPGRPKKQTLF